MQGLPPPPLPPPPIISGPQAAQYSECWWAVMCGLYLAISYITVSFSVERFREVWPAKSWASRGFTVWQFNCQECWNISVWFNRMAMFGSDILMQGKGSFYSVLVYLIMISINSFQAFRLVIDLLKWRTVSLWDWLSGEDLYRDTINDQFHYRPIVKMVEIAQSQMWTLWNVLLCVIDSLKSKDM